MFLRIFCAESDLFRFVSRFYAADMEVHASFAAGMAAAVKKSLRELHDASARFDAMD
jgi:hypothetical protein